MKTVSDSILIETSSLNNRIKSYIFTTNEYPVYTENPWLRTIKEIVLARGWDYSSWKTSEVRNPAEKLVNIVRTLARGTARCAAARVRSINQRCLCETGTSRRNFSHFASCPVNNTRAPAHSSNLRLLHPPRVCSSFPSSSFSSQPRVQLLFLLPTPFLHGLATYSWNRIVIPDTRKFQTTANSRPTLQFAASRSESAWIPPIFTVMW